MPLITPLSSIPATRPDGVAAASILLLLPGGKLWVDGRVTAGTCTIRPYYWSDEPASSAGILGAWIPLGGDAVSGTSGTSFALATRGGCSNGRYECRRAPAQWVLVEEAAAGVAYDFVHLSSED